MPKGLNIILLQGGNSKEREVSLSSGQAVHDALIALGHRVEVIDPKQDLQDFVQALKQAFAGTCDVIFNALHGKFGEDGHIQAIAALLGMKITHSGLLSSALAMDKLMAKKILFSQGIPVANGEKLQIKRIQHYLPIPYPFVIKPVGEGSSVGVTIVQQEDDLPNWSLLQDGDYMIEEYVHGRELTVAVMRNQALNVTEIVPSQGFYDYKAKYTDGIAPHTCPANIPEFIANRCKFMAEAAHMALGCKGVSRADFRYDEEGIGGVKGRLVMLEVNTQPGMTNLSLVPEQAAANGIGFHELVQMMIDDAL